MAEPKELLAILKGLPQDVADKILASAQAEAEKARTRAEAQAKLDSHKSTISKSLEKVVADIKVDFDVRVRAGQVEVHLVGVSGAGRSVGAPKATPIKDSGMTMKQLVEQYTPDKIVEYEQADGNAKYNLAMKALKIKQGASKTTVADEKKSHNK